MKSAKLLKVVLLVAGGVCSIGAFLYGFMSFVFRRTYARPLVDVLNESDYGEVVVILERMAFDFMLPMAVLFGMNVVL